MLLEHNSCFGNFSKLNFFNINSKLIWTYKNWVYFLGIKHIFCTFLQMPLLEFFSDRDKQAFGIWSNDSLMVQPQVFVQTVYMHCINLQLMQVRGERQRERVSACVCERVWCVCVIKRVAADKMREY